ncbi:hypothetical protein CC86DRAFT_152788 [Ophiobolus disseminans]|uniref:Uncharacterized protein n=1 Tax=Ophiobolus disseminans TaxID=1469910 RepID=A0A6A6ZF58_9PLEO|nr:hypothetical protein CC86DRAFT_152788 [Ophiobolus disseminans]
MDVPKRRAVTGPATSEPLDPPQYCQLLSGGLSEKDDEKVGLDKEAGYGIVQLLADNKAAWMRPTKGVNLTDQPADWVTPGEYTRELRRIYDLSGGFPATRVDLVTVEEHAVYPNRSSHRYATASGVVEKTTLGSLLRFTRSSIDKDGVLYLWDHECGKCALPLCAVDYLYCHRCAEVFHTQCTEAREWQPFAIRSATLYDSRGQPVLCPGCMGDADPEKRHILSDDSIGSSTEYGIVVCIDIGSTSPGYR